MPYPYQAFAEKFVLEHKAAGLFLDMGLGKTAITLSACEKLLRDYFETSKVLVIAPLLPARETWPDELAKWDQLEGLTYSLIIGTAQERIDALHTDADFYIVNRENVVWLVDYYKKKWPFDMVVIDELSSFKSSKAQRFRALRKVRKYIAGPERPTRSLVSGLSPGRRRAARSNVVGLSRHLLHAWQTWAEWNRL